MPDQVTQRLQSGLSLAAAWNAGDGHAWAAHFHEDAVGRVPERWGLVSQKHLRGRDDMLAWFEGVRDAGDMRFRTVTAWTFDDWLVTRSILQFTGRTSGSEHAEEVYMGFRYRGDLISESFGYAEEARALAHVGLDALPAPAWTDARA